VETSLLGDMVRLDRTRPPGREGDAWDGNVLLGEPGA
jgi:hypothetical protein